MPKPPPRFLGYETSLATRQQTAAHAHMAMNRPTMRKPDDEEADVVEVQAGDSGGDWVGEAEVVVQDADQLDRADQERDGNGQSGGGQVVEDLADWVGECPLVGARVAKARRCNTAITASSPPVLIQSERCQRIGATASARAARSLAEGAGGLGGIIWAQPLEHLVDGVLMRCRRSS